MGYVRFDLPLKGAWSDLTATFDPDTDGQREGGRTRDNNRKGAVFLVVRGSIRADTASIESAGP